MMKHKILAFCTTIIALISCNQGYTIQGNSEIPLHNGKMLYLRATHPHRTIVDIDSCQVTHGVFSFYGDTDSITIVGLYVGNQQVMPIVLEQGDLTIEVGQWGTSLRGSQHNDKLNKLLRERNQIMSKQEALRRKSIEMLYRGKSIEEVEREVSKASAELVKQLELLETRFIQDNYNTPLGPGYFHWLFGQYPIPVITPQIRTILDHAPHTFKQHPFIREYIRQASTSMER